MFVRQFRPSLDAHKVEFPAGLVDSGETPAQAAIRELKEETGCKGVAVSASSPMGLSPGLTSDTLSLVRVDVDMDLAENAHHITEPDEGEYVDRIVSPIDQLSVELDRYETAGDGSLPDLRSFAAGF